MAAPLRCTLTTPEEKVFEGDARAVVVPATDGELGILPRHAPLVGSLGYGELRIDVEGKGTSRYFIDGGFLQILDNQVSVLAARAVALEGLDTAAEEAAVQGLVDRKPGRGASLEERDDYAHALSVAKARLRLAKKV